jgi:hypothetical protein
MLRHLNQAGERSWLGPFVVATGDTRPRDQRHLMQRPFFVRPMSHPFMAPDVNPATRCRAKIVCR